MNIRNPKKTNVLTLLRNPNHQNVFINNELHNFREPRKGNVLIFKSNPA